MTSFLFFVGAIALGQGATTAPPDFGPSGPVIVAKGGKAKLPDGLSVELVGLAEAAAHMKPWDAAGKPLNGGALKDFEKALSLPQARPTRWGEGTRHMIVVFRVLSPQFASANVNMEPPAMPRISGGTGSFVFSQFELPASGTEVKARITSTVMHNAWRTVGYFSLDGKSSMDGIAFRTTNRQEDSRANKALLTMSGIVPWSGEYRDWRVVDCGAAGVPKGTQLVPQPAHPRSGKRMQTMAFNVMCDLNSRSGQVFRLEAQPRAVALFTIPAHAAR